MTDIKGDPIRQENPPAQSANGGTTNDKQESAELKKIAKGERWLIGTGIASALISAGLGIIYILQLREMTNATKATRAAVYETCRSSQVSRSALLEAIQSGNDAHNASIASTYQTIVSARSEAAYVLPYFDTPLSFIVNGRISVTPGMRNEGKTTARNIFLKTRLVFVRKDENPPLVFPKEDTATTDTPSLESGKEPLNRGGFVSVGGAKHSYIATPQDLADLNSHEKDILAFGRVTFDDYLGVHHWVQVCNTFPGMENRTKATNHYSCIHYNKSDRNSAVQLASAKPIEITIPEVICTEPKD